MHPQGSNQIKSNQIPTPPINIPPSIHPSMPGSNTHTHTARTVSKSSTFYDSSRLRFKRFTSDFRQVVYMYGWNKYHRRFRAFHNSIRYVSHVQIDEQIVRRALLSAWLRHEVRYSCKQAVLNSKFDPSVQIYHTNGFPITLIRL